MSEKPLLLPEAKTIVLVKRRTLHSTLRAVFVVLGVLVVMYGAADVLSRAATLDFGIDANQIAFGPAITALPHTGVTQTKVASSTPLTPVRISIPSIGVDAVVESVGKDAQGTMKTPSTFSRVAWYSPGSKPGQAGNAVLAGHVNNALTKAGVFEHLADIALGATITVFDSSGQTLTYTVRDVENYATDGAPADVIFSRMGPPQLVLVTCAGDWDSKTHSFNKRLVVFAMQAQQ